MYEPIEDQYFRWLCAKVISTENPTPSLTYWKLLTDLHGFEFVWVLSGDDNRLEDGLDLRHDFLVESQLESDPEWFYVGCSVLEMLIAFSKRTSFETASNYYDWFWLFIDNLGLMEFNDASDYDTDLVKAILDRFVWRTYDFNGRGGLFPLTAPKHDQRKIEIWYQFAEYVVDQERL